MRLAVQPSLRSYSVNRSFQMNPRPFNAPYHGHDAVCTPDSGFRKSFLCLNFCLKSASLGRLKT